MAGVGKTIFEKDVEEDDEDSGDDERSLGSSDKEEEKDGEGSSDEGEDEEEEGEGDEDGSSSSSDEDDSEQSEDSDESDDSELWDELNVSRAPKSQEATEANALSEFQRALDYLVEGKKEKAAKILNHLLKQDIVNQYHKEFINWEAEGVERLSKMARLFVGVHKNLAHLQPDNAMNHYLQILHMAPRNPQYWMWLGEECVRKGDLDLAAYALETQAEGDPRAMDALIGVHYLTGNYHACLHLIKDSLEANPVYQKGLILKKQIRMISDHYSDFCDRLFDEDRRYGQTYEDGIDPEVEKQMLCRLHALQERLRSRQNEEMASKKMDDPMEPVQVTISEKQTLVDVATILCDLWDRVAAYSSLIFHPITFARWCDPDVPVAVGETLDRLLDTIDAVEKVVDEVQLNETEGDASMREAAADDGVAEGVRRSARVVEQNMDDDDGRASRASRTSAKTGLSRQFGLFPCWRGEGLRGGVASSACSQRTASRTPTPPLLDAVDMQMVLIRLRHKTLDKQAWNMHALVGMFLQTVCEFCPKKGAVPSLLQPLIVQLYRRWTSAGRVSADEDMCVHVLCMELGERQAEEHVQLWQLARVGRPRCFSTAHAERDWALRVAWIRLSSLPDSHESKRIHGLERMRKALFHGDETCAPEMIYTANGGFSVDEIDRQIDVLRRKTRLQSLRLLQHNKQYDEIIDIVRRDMDWSRVEVEEVLEAVRFWMAALEEKSLHNERAKLICRMFAFVAAECACVEEERKEETVRWLLHSLRQVDMSRVDRPLLCTAGGYVLELTERAGESWKTEAHVWKTLHRIVKHTEGGLQAHAIRDRLLELDSLGDELPTRALDVLSRAHDMMSEADRCAQDRCSFLVYYLHEMAECVRLPGVRAMLKEEKSLAWVWSNVQEELAQLLACAFGRYAKKRRALCEHTCQQHVKQDDIDMHLAKDVMSLVLPYPLPAFDDQERVPSDTVELILNRFKFLCNVDEKRERSLTQFRHWLEQGKKMRDAEGVWAWPSTGCDHPFQADAIYTLALYYYRSNSTHEDARKWAELFITSGQARPDRPETGSAWAILAHSTVSRLFQLHDDDVALEWEWHVHPFRVAVSLLQGEALVHFELATTLYQLATRLSRFHRVLSADDLRVRRGERTVAELRAECAHHLDVALSLAPNAAGASDYHWLCYLLSAKLHAKESDYSVVRVLDGLFEAACALQLNEYQYPAKVPIKNQKNIEPVEVHYHAHAAAWKWIQNNDDPDTSTLASVVAYLRAFQNHGVCRGAVSSLFHTPIEVIDTVVSLTVDAVKMVGEEQEEEKESDGLVIAGLVDSLTLRADLLEEVLQLCAKGFETCVERFPHVKAHYRLAEMAAARGEWKSAGHILSKGVFRRSKKKDEKLLECVVEITCADIDRSGSFSFHVGRCVQLAAAAATRTNDMAQLVALLQAVVVELAEDSEEFLWRRQQVSLCQLLWKSVRFVATRLTTGREGGRPPGRPASAAKAAKEAQTEMVKLADTLEKHAKAHLRIAHLRGVCEKLCTQLFGDYAQLRAAAAEGAEKKKPGSGRKRKVSVEDLADPAKTSRFMCRSNAGSDPLSVARAVLLQARKPATSTSTAAAATPAINPALLAGLAGLSPAMLNSFLAAAASQAKAAAAAARPVASAPAPPASTNTPASAPANNDNDVIMID